MQKVELIGKTQKGRNRVREKGRFAMVADVSPEVFFSTKHGPWLFIRPHERWVNQNNDDDFEVKSVREE